MHRKFHLNMRKSFFTVWVTVQWNRLPTEVVEPSLLELFKSCLDTILCSVHPNDPAGAGEWDQITYCCPFQS